MKKRYQITLTVENVERFQRIAKLLNMGQNAMSRTLDDSLMSMAQTFEALYNQGMKKGKVTMADMFQAIADELERQEVHEDKTVNQIRSK